MEGKRGKTGKDRKQMFEKKDVQSKIKKDDRKKWEDKDRGQRDKSEGGQGQRKEKQYEDGERSEQ